MTLLLGVGIWRSNIFFPAEDTLTDMNQGIEHLKADHEQKQPERMEDLEYNHGGYSSPATGSYPDPVEVKDTPVAENPNSTVDNGLRYDHHLSNGTYSTALQLTGFDKHHAKISPLAFARAARETPYYTTILPAMINYYETDSFIFTHGWIPCVKDEAGSLSYMDGWREASEQSWRQARWINGIDAVRTVFEDGKTIVCGHWHTSYGHSRFEGKGTEFGRDADFSPYVAPGIIALDACTAYSGIVNCIIVEDG